MLQHIPDIILWFVVFFMAISFHESAHAWTSSHYGDPTARHLGRITLNPLAHIDPIGSIVFPLIALFAPGAPVFGWAKPTPVNPSMWRDRKRAGIMVALAGPMSNMFLFLIAFAVTKALIVRGLAGPAAPPPVGGPFDIIGPNNPDSQVLIPICKILSIMLELNLVLAIFNLIPVHPLDGSAILENVLPYEVSHAYSQLRPWGIFLLVGLMLLGVFDMILRPAFSAMFKLLGLS